MYCGQWIKNIIKAINTSYIIHNTNQYGEKLKKN